MRAQGVIGVGDRMRSPWRRAGVIALLCVVARLPHLPGGAAAGPGPWTASASLHVARTAHTATLLPTGQVLVAGGLTNAPNAPSGRRVLASAELYDPHTCTWRLTGSMHTARWSHTATLLPTGHVLVVGGSTTLPGASPPLASAELYDPRTERWTPTAPLATARTAHAAILLLSGQVLVIGGLHTCTAVGDCPGVASAELYDPRTARWTPTGPMTIARPVGFTATLLSTGQVLVAGGTYGRTTAGRASPWIDSAELYDPQRGRWTPTGRMTSGRADHTATLLPDGRVLVAGGFTMDMTSVELYTPRTGHWTPTSRIHNTSHVGHTATLLPNDQVLVVGSPNGEPPTAELFDPFSGLWTATASPSPRESVTFLGGHTATLLPDGTVLIAGGCCADEKIRATAEVYTPGAHVPPPPRLHLTLSRRDLSFDQTVVGTPSLTQTVILSNTGSLTMTTTITSVVVTGPNATDFALTTTCVGAQLLPLDRCRIAVVFTPTTAGARRASIRITAATPDRPQDVALSGTGVAPGGPNTWAPTGSMTTPRADPLLVRLRTGQVLAIGGAGQDDRSAEVYTPGTGRWTPTGAMRIVHDGATVTLLRTGKVLVVGGTSDASGDLNHAVAEAELYDPRTGTWSVTGSLHDARYGHAATLLPDGHVLVTGGCCDAPPGCEGEGGGCSLTLSSAELYDPRTGRWRYTDNMSTARESHTATLLADGRVLVAGGMDEPDGLLATVEVYDPQTGRWTATGALHTARQAHLATLLHDGRVLVAGGYDSGGVTILSAEVYDPRTGRWVATGSLRHLRGGGSITLPSGRVLAVGRRLDNSCGSAEVYDPGTSRWTPTGPLITGVCGRPVLLPTEQVLVVGGVDSSGHASSHAAVYTPAP